MSGFFKPWRRKCAVVIVAMSCITLAVWLRSFLYEDTVVLPTGCSLYPTVTSRLGRLEIQVEPTAIPSAIHFHWTAETLVTTEQVRHVLNEGMRSPFLGIQVGIQRGSQMTRYVAAIPYWTFILPATFASFWLLVSKPKSARQVLQSV